MSVINNLYRNKRIIY